MKILTQLMLNFSALQLRDRIISVAVGCSVLALGGNLVLIKPLQVEIDKVRALDQAHKSEIAKALKDIADVDGKLSSGIDPLQRERETRDELVRKIAEADAFYAQHDTKDSQVGTLVRKLLDESPGLTLVSLKTLPSQVFYAPPAPPPPPKVTERAVEDVAQLLKLSKQQPVAGAAPAPPAALQKIIYKHGVEVSVSGNYIALVSYLEALQKYPKRVFWSEAKMTVSPYPVTTLKFVIYTLSDQQIAPLS